MRVVVEVSGGVVVATHTSEPADVKIIDWDSFESGDADISEEEAIDLIRSVNAERLK